MAKRGRKASKKDNGSSANIGFEAKLWAAADKMRGHMDAAEYKHVALGLIFLKYISDAFVAHVPMMKGFSLTNISRMRAFYLAYTKGVTNLPQPVGGLGDGGLAQRAAHGVERRLCCSYRCDFHGRQNASHELAGHGPIWSSAARHKTGQGVRCSSCADRREDESEHSRIEDPGSHR